MALRRGNTIKPEAPTSSSMDPDDVAYRKSVKNTVIVLVVVVGVLVASLAAATYVSVPQNTFQTRTSVASTFPFTLNLAISATTGTTAGGVTITAWLNGTSTANVTAYSSWPVDQSRLWRDPCSEGWPIGVGVMQGHHTTDNYSLGTLAILRGPQPPCPAPKPLPRWFYFSSQTSKVLVTIGGEPEFWVIASEIAFNPGSVGVSRLSPGIYTAVAADEWGDLALTNFRIT